MAYVIGALLPIIGIGALIYYICTDVKDEYKSKKDLEKLAKKNRDEILGKRY